MNKGKKSTRARSRAIQQRTSGNDFRFRNYNWDLRKSRTSSHWAAIHAALLMDLREALLLGKSETASTVRTVMAEAKSMIMETTHEYLHRIEEVLTDRLRPRG